MFLGMTCRIVKPIALLLGLSASLVACVDSSNNAGGTSQYLTVASQKASEHGLQLAAAADYSTSTLRDVAKGNGIYVVVGDNGVIITSKDGSTWQTQGGVVSANLSGVTYNPVNKLFYAVGDAGLIISSADGVTWTIYKNLTPTVKLNSIMSVKGDEIIAGESGNVFEVAVTSKRGLITVRGLDVAVNATATSFNGSDMMVIGTAAGGLYYKTYSTFSTSNWTKTNTLTNMPVSDISYDSIDSWFTATTLNGAVIQSSDGKSWSSPILVNSAGSINLNSIALEPLSNNFIVVGSDAAQKPYTRFSYDFNQWSDYSVAAQSQIQKIRCFDASSCVAVGDNEALSFATKKSDLSGMDWKSIDLIPPQPNASYVAVGESGTILVSTDGKSWLPESSAVNGSLNSVSYNTKLGRYIITGSFGSILASSDGRNWSKESSHSSSSLYGYSNSADIYLIPGTSATILTSSDGVNWESRETNLPKYVNLYGSAYNGKDRFVVIGTHGMIISSANGINWTQESSNTNDYLSSIIYDGKQFVIVGTHGIILTSSDGVNWKQQVSNVEVALNDIIYENNMYVIVGNDGTVLKSVDATVWKTSHVNEDIKLNLQSIAYFKNQYVAVGGGGTILTSEDSITWKNESSGTNAQLYDVKSH